MEHVVIGSIPTRCRPPIEVVDGGEQLLGSGRFTTDRAGYAAMRTYAGAWPERVWALQGSNQALLADSFPGQAKRDVSTGQAEAMLTSVRPRDIAGKPRRRRAEPAPPVPGRAGSLLVD